MIDICFCFKIGVTQSRIKWSSMQKLTLQHLINQSNDNSRKAIWKSWHWHWHWHWLWCCKKSHWHFAFHSRILHWKIVYLCSFFRLVIWHQYHSTTNTYFSTISHSSILKRPLLLLKKTVRVFRSSRPLVFRKNSCSKIFGNFPVKHRWWSSSVLHLQPSLAILWWTFQRQFL